MKARNADLASSVLAFVRMNPFNDNGESATSFFQSGAAQQSVLETHRRALLLQQGVSKTPWLQGRVDVLNYLPNVVCYCISYQLSFFRYWI